MVTDKFKLMTLMVMSFLFLLNTSYADSSDEVEKAVKKVKSAASREINQHGIGIGLGQTFLLGNFERYGDNKITGDIFYTYTASYSFDFLANLHSSRHSYKDKDVDLKGLNFSIKGRPYEFDNFSPYFVAGLGFYWPVIYKDSESSDEKNTFGFNVGAGVDLRLNYNFVVGLLGQFHNPFDIKQDDFNDVRGSYFKLLMTAMYLF